MGLYLLFLFISCQREQVTVSPEELARQDSLALHVAVMPVMDCLPLYYAQRTGMFEEAGVDVRLHTYLSLMDCDTALLRGHAEVCYTDIPRTLEMQGDSAPLRIITGMDGRVSLVMARKQRIRSLKHLGERMIAIDRLSVADMWSDHVMHAAGLEQSAIYRPQINDVQLRLAMLEQQLVDGAILSEPYATMGVMEGNKRLCESNDSLNGLTCLVTRRQWTTDTLRMAQIEKLMRVYDHAVDVLNRKEAQQDTLRTILLAQYNVSRETADTIVLPTLPTSFVPDAEKIGKVFVWLQSRERRIGTTARDSLIWRKRPSNN